MPTVSRTRTVLAAPDEVWRVLSDPDQLPRWWPAVKRVEDVSADAFTMVLSSSRGKTVRADYTLLEVEPLARLIWRQEVEESPFERILRQSVTELKLVPEGSATRVELTERNATRGFARFGGLQLRRAMRRRLDEALDSLAGLFAPAETA
jgi:uncharacterized protein YndB with AHSA1/START domain